MSGPWERIKTIADITDCIYLASAVFSFALFVFIRSAIMSERSPQRVNLLPKGGPIREPAVMAEHLMAILRRTKASPWLLVKTAITMVAAKMKKKTKTVFCPPF